MKPTRMKRWMGVAFGLCALATTTSCIDEDLDDCPTKLRIDYTMRLHTNLDTEISTELATAGETAMGTQLRNQLSGVLTNHASDVALSFFTSGKLAHEESRTLNASQGTFSITLPAQQYRHLALANVGQEPQVSVEGRNQLDALTLTQSLADTIDSHRAGLFTARLGMDVEGRDQEFRVDLYMVNAATALVIDRNGLQPDAIWGYVSGMATAYSVSDSTYVTGDSPVIRTNALTANQHHALYAACMPSGKAQDWLFTVYVRLNGKVTQTVLQVPEPLLAGNLKIIKGKLASDGSIVPNAQNIGATVTLDWKEGGHHEIEI